MRLFKPAYTLPIPPGAKILDRKGGKVVRWDSRGEQREAKLTKAGDRIRIETNCWHIGFLDGGAKRTLKGFTDRASTQRLADTVQSLMNCKATRAPFSDDLQDAVAALPDEQRSELVAWGLLEPTPEPEAEPEKLAAWIDGFEDWLKATKADSGYHRNANHIATVMGRVRAIVSGCHFETWADIKKQKIEVYLGDLPLSNRTHNGYVAAIKQFCAWVVDTAEKAEFSPLGKLKRVKVQHKEKRRPLAFDEVRKILTAAQNGPVRHGMTGPDRAILYLLAIETGFRRNELFHLTPACFNLTKATVRLDGAYTKNRQETVQLIRLGLSPHLTAFLMGKDPAELMFRLKTPRTAEMIHEDAIAAGVPLVDDRGAELVFHSLRHTLRTELKAARVDSEIVNAIMRHSPKGVGEKHYSHITDFQKREALERLPEYPWPAELQKQPLTKTGTDDMDFLVDSCSCVGQVRTITDSIDSGTPIGIAETAILCSGAGSVRSSEPVVGGSSPSGRISQERDESQ